MSDAMFSIDLDVSRALAAQQAMLRGFDEVAKAGNRITSGMSGASGEFSKIENSIKGVGAALGSISSSTNLKSELASLQKINDEMNKLRRMNELGLGGIPESSFKKVLADAVELNGVLRTMDRVVNALASQLKALPQHKFDFSSVEEYRSKLNNLGNELNALKAFKASLDPIDYSKMKGSLETAINTTKQQFRDFTGSKDPYGMIAAFERTFNTIAVKSQTLVKDSLAVTKRFITGNEVADSMGLNYKGGLDTLTRNITEATNKVEAEAKRLNQVLKTSFVGQGTPSNTQAQLLASATKYYNNISFGGGKISHGDIAKSMGFGDDLVGKATSAIPIVNQLATHVDNVGKKAEESKSRLTGLGLVIKRVFEYGIVYRFQNALLSIPGAIWDATVAVEKLKTTYTGVFQAGGENQFEYALDSARKYGKSIESIGESYKKFAVTSEYLGMSQTQTRKIFESVNQAMVKAGGTSDNTKNAFIALEQMLSKGTVSAEEFRRQFAQYIPGAMSMGAKALGVTTGEFKKLLASGEIVSLEFIPKLAEQLAKFGEGWQKAADTIEANSERLKNSSTMLGFNLLTTLVSESDIKTLQKRVEEVVNIINAGLERIKPKSEDSGLLTKAAYYTSLLGNPVSLFKEGYTQIAGSSKSDSAGINSYWNQYKEGVLATAKELQQILSNPADISPESGRRVQELNEKLALGLKTVHELCDPNWNAQVSVTVDTTQITYAMGLINKLYASSKFGKIEDAAKSVTSVKKEMDAQKSIIEGLESKTTDPTVSAREKERAYNQLVKVQADYTKSTIALTAAEGAYFDLVKAGSQIENKSAFLQAPRNSGETKKAQIEKATQQAEEAKKAIQAAFSLDQGPAGAKALSKSDMDKEIQGWDSWLTGTIKNINKQGAGGENAAKRAAIATDKYAESIENLLKKEFALAQDNPLDASFASIDEKVNSLTHRMEELALKSGAALKDIPAQIAKFKELARGEAVDKQLENLFPWMKHEKEVVVLWDMLGEKWKYASAEAKKHGMAEEELTEKIYNLIAATQQLNKEQKTVADADAATNFKDYAKAMQELDSAKYGEKGTGEKEAIEEFYDTYVTLTKGMTESRLEMYRRVAEQAKANGMDEAQAAAYVSSKWQEAEVQRLEAIQKYGSASEAFSARLAQNFETYKDTATKSRESAVQMADSISNMADTVSSGIGQAFGDMIRNIGNGNAKIEDMWKNMLARMLDALASFIEEAITKWTKNLLGNMFSSSGTQGSSFLGSLFGGSSSSSATSIGSDATGGSSTSTWKSIGKSISDSMLGSVSSGSGEAASFLSSLSKANASGISDVFKNGNISGWNFADGTKATGSAVSGALGLTSGAGSILSTVGSVLGVVGGVAGLVGLAASLFGGEKKEVKKTASGYNVGVVGGRTGIYNVDFYSDGSVMNAGTTNPDIAKKVSDAFKDTAESLHDFAKELNFAVDVLDDFNFPSMNVTEDQLDGYIRNGQNAMAFLALEKAGLRGAFDFVAEDYEVYVDEFERLSTAISTAGGSLSAYGYDLYTLAGLNAEKVAEIRAKTVEVAAGTADAYAAMATSMGASAEAVEYLRSAAGDGSQALSVTDEQLETILEADWASKVIDKVGGEDAFSSIMENLYRNVFDSVEKYANNLEFYTEKANKYIGKLGDSTVTIDNFWQKFDEALKGYLSPEEFEQWADASSWVNQIDTVNDLVEEWNNSMTKFAQSLDARMQAAEGLDYQSELTQQLAAAEWELYEARKAGYDAALIARLQEVQAAELAATKRKHNEEYVEELRDARERYYSATGDDRGLIDIQMEKNRAELLELSKTYNWSPGSSEEKLFQAIEQAQAAELYNMIKELADKIVSAIESLNLESREATAAGNSDLAGALDLISGFTKEYKSAAEAGVDAATLERLQKVQQAELANYWAEVNGSIIKVNETLEDIRDALLDTFNTFIESQIDAIQSALDNAQTLASAYRSAQTSIQDTLTSWATDSDPSLNAEQTFLNNQAVFGSLFKKAMAGDEEAFGKLAGAAGSYRDSAQAYYGNKSQYEEFYRNLVIQMNQAGDKAGTLADEQDNFAKLYQVQLDLYNLLKTEINSDDPNTAKLQAVVDAIGFTNEAIKTGNTTTSVLQNLTSSGNGGYADIVDAISGQSSLPNTYLSTLVSKQTTLNALMAQFLNVQQKNNLQAQVDAAKTEYLSYYNNAKAAFQSSSVGSFIQAMGNSGFGSYGAARLVGELTTTGYGWSNGRKAYDAMIASGTSASDYGSWFLNNYGVGSGYVDWDTAMMQWLSSYGSLPSGSSSNYSAYQSSYQKYQQLLAQLSALGGYADGGISSGAQLAWVSEGTYSNEAHVPLPDGRTIPVTITDSGDTESVSLLAEIRAELEDMRQQQRAIGVEVIKANNTTAKILTEWKNIGMPTTQESN